MNRIVFLTCTLFLTLTAQAAAEPVEVTAQAKTANAEFLLRAVPPGAPAAICLVDTGVNTNPDTAAISVRRSVYGLDGTDQSPSLHGTQLAMLMAAPRNDFGMVGFWPVARVVSVQANKPGLDEFEPIAFATAIDDCTEIAPAFQIRVIAVAGASETPLTADEIAGFREVLARARQSGISVVAAAGNLFGRPVGAPASMPGVVSVGAMNASTGAACGDSAAGAFLAAPGCAIDGAHPVTGQPLTSQHGTSASAVLAATGLAALYTWRPDLVPDAAEQLLAQSAGESRRFDLAGAFALAGLRSVAQPAPTEPTATPSPQSSTTPTATKRRFAKPRVSVRFRQRLLTVRSLNRPGGAIVTVQVFTRDSRDKLRRVTTRKQAATAIKVRVGRWTRLRVEFSDPKGVFLTSRPTTVKR